MILQYKGYKNNWCYEEANTITYSVVYVGDILKHINSIEMKFENSLDEARYIQEQVDKYILEETGCTNIVYNIGDTPFKDMKNIYVVNLSGDGRDDKYITHVFTKGVYLLNNSGKTIQKIC